MKKRRRQFYVPRIDSWHWERLTDTFLRVQLKRVDESFAETENALGVMDAQTDELTKLAFTEYRKGTPRLRETIEKIYSEICDERKRVTRIQEELTLVRGRLRSELKHRHSKLTRIEHNVSA